MKSLIQRIDNMQKEKLFTLEEMRTHLKTKQRGLYWIWTNLDYETLKNRRNDKIETAEVPFSKLINQRETLKNITKVSIGAYRVVYNGIGGYLNDSKGFGLRERINQEFNCNDYRTGTLNIARGFNLDNWRISFFNFDAPKNKEIIQQLDTNNPYKDYAKDLEIIWRLEYGTPILCRQ